MHRAASDEWKITNCTCFHYSRRDPATGRTHKRFRWEQTARPVFDGAEGRWVVKVEDWRNSSVQCCLMAIWWTLFMRLTVTCDVCWSVDCMIGLADIDD